MRIKLTLAYTGTNYAGWQIQKNSLTIQEVLENVIFKICGQRVRVHGASRTDAGVHALGQVAHFDVPSQVSKVNWQRALNSFLPADISVIQAQEVGTDFHSRFSAKAKIYSYTFWTESRFIYPQRRPFVWPCGPLHPEQLMQISPLLEGEHDFRALMNAGTKVKSTVKTIYWIKFCPGVYPQELVMRIKGSGFLKQMVRNIAGLLWLAGNNKIDANFVQELLASKSRQLWPPTAPAAGLTLEKIFY
ncbi:MAG: tRNA pseudouridine(38-40) synthase TruA [Desulfonauticus sp.]|nr:tRNA pseudouridine(38-40) synthase TruA [Desulfonauticus sp.]